MGIRLSTRFATRLATWAAVAAAVMLAVMSASILPAHAASFVPLTGDGSSWAEPAIDQWARDVNGRGIVINYSGDGSHTGRQHYIVDQADFAASDIAFLTKPDPFGSAQIEQPNVAYSYVPITAGGTSFLYNLVVGGRKITNLRLSGLTLAKIFTGKITNWDDPAIARDYGAPLPSQKITPVMRADGSGASYMLSQWMAKQYPSIWNPFCSAEGGSNGCGPTEFYPQFTGSVERNGSDQVASYISSPGLGEGSIGYDEYAYALDNNIPVVKVLNSAGYYTLPTASNVAIALQAAVINNDPTSPNYLIQDLDRVYTNPDKRSYPLSSYSYLIVPRSQRTINGNPVGPPERFSGDQAKTKGPTLSTWLDYVLCGAQQKAGALGYSPLPKNLIVGGFQQVNAIPDAPSALISKELAGCNNPTYSDGVNHLIVDAPQPSPCDKLGAPLICVVGGGSSGGNNSGSSRKNSGGGSSTNTGGGSGGNSSNTAGSTGTSNNGGTTTTTGGSQGGAIDPDTGVTVESTTTEAGGSTYAVPVALSASNGKQNWLLAGFTSVDIAAAVLVPGLLGAWLRRRRRPRS